MCSNEDLTRTRRSIGVLDLEARLGNEAALLVAGRVGLLRQAANWVGVAGAAWSRPPPATSCSPCAPGGTASLSRRHGVNVATEVQLSPDEFMLCVYAQ